VLNYSLAKVSICESKLQEDEKEEIQTQKAGGGTISNIFPSIPGLDPTATLCSPTDENLPPLEFIPSKSFQYGRTNLIFSPVVEILTSSDLKKNTQKCQKKRRKGNRKKLEVVKRANTPQCSKGIFPTVTRCVQCFVNHFPNSKFCKLATKLANLPDNVCKVKITILRYLDDSTRTICGGAYKKIQKTPKPESKQFKIDENLLNLIQDKTLFLETMLNCGYSVQDLYASSTDFKPIRLRGGANKDNNEGVKMVKKGN
jgi:hypothetical protein